MAFDEDSNKPDADDASKRRNRNSSSSGKESGINSGQDIGFMLNGVDIRKVDVSELGALLEVEESSESEHEVLPYPPELPKNTRPRQRTADTAPTVPDWLTKAAFPPADLFDPKSYSSEMGNKRCFRISSDNMLYYVQMRFSEGYQGVVTLSQAMMFALLSAKNEALRAGSKDIGCEHIFLALLQQQGFAAGQLLTSLHLNNIGKPRSLGDCYGLSRRAVLRLDDDTTFGARMIFPARTAAGTDTYFTNEAEQMLIDAMCIAARSGLSQTHSKQVLTALLETKSASVRRAFDALAISEKEIRSALTECPEQDRVGDFLAYFMTAILNGICRFRVIKGPIGKYAKYAHRRKTT